MIKRSFQMTAIILIMILTGALSRAVEFTGEGKTILPDKTETPIAIDGELNEPVWALPALNREFKTLTPQFGMPLGEETLVWAAYDEENIYFAFKCLDTQPDKIKTSISQRDKILNDDLVGVLLDTLGIKQSSIEFYVNPNGIQMDAVNSSVSGSDFSADFVYESAGKLIPQGYQVEIRIPLESIRYQVGKNKTVNMRVMFLRQITRLGAMATWPEFKPGQTDLNCMTDMVYRGLKAGFRLEILPNFTFNRDSERETSDTFSRSSDTNVGVSLKYGITSAITAEATVNPDYSQVESDIFQAEVNRRYPLFYSEKRPFFMESQEVLDFTIVHDAMASLLEYGMMESPIHTRRIVDPGWAVKFSGSSGKVKFAVLAADDRSPGHGGIEGGNPYEGKSALFGIFRAKYNLGADNSLGILYSGRRFSAAGERNDVGGLDLKYRLSKNLRASFSYLRSATRSGEELPTQQGNGWNGILQYLTPRIICMASYERYDEDFYMATAFQNRVGISRWWLGIGPYINVNIKALPWLKRIVPYLHYTRLHDLGTHLNDISRVLGLYINFAPKGELYLEHRIEDEAWQGQLFDKNHFIVLGNIQVLNWLFVQWNMYLGGQIYYDPANPFLGIDNTISLGVFIEPNIKLKMGIEYLHSNFKNKQTDEKVYSLDITNLNATYQFNKYFFLRGILRYDNLQNKLLTDILASFTLIPGTVVHLGYGSLYLKNQWQENQWIPAQGDLLKMRESLFFKASYLWRIK